MTKYGRGGRGRGGECGGDAGLVDETTKQESRGQNARAKPARNAYPV